MPLDYGAIVADVLRDGARGYQLKFARERLEKLRAKLDVRHVDWIDDINYAIAQIKAAEN